MARSAIGSGRGRAYSSQMAARQGRPFGLHRQVQPPATACNSPVFTSCVEES